MKYLKIIALTVVSLVMLSCTKNDKDTIILLGKETYVQDIVNVIADSLRPTFNQYMGGIHDGYIPPKVEGDFIVSKKQRVYSNIGESWWPLTVNEPDMYLRIEDQHNRVARLTLAESTVTQTDTVYVIGNNNENFTLYYIENKTISYLGATTQIKRAMLFNGAVSDFGIKDLTMATVILDVRDNSGGSIVQYEKGDFFIYKDSDGIAERKNW